MLSVGEINTFLALAVLGEVDKTFALLLRGFMATATRADDLSLRACNLQHPALDFGPSCLALVHDLFLMLLLLSRAGSCPSVRFLKVNREAPPPASCAALPSRAPSGTAQVEVLGTATASVYCYWHLRALRPMASAIA